MSLPSLKASLSSVMSRSRAAAPAVAEPGHDGPMPLKRDEVSALLRHELGEIHRDDKLRASERLERDSLALIRNALYPDDGPARPARQKP